MCLVVCFYVGDSDSIVTSIRQRSHIKSLLVSMFHYIWNLKYFRHIRIASCVGFEPFMFTINFDAISFNVFNSLIYMFRCKDITVMNQ